MKVLLIYPNFLEDRVHVEEISVPPQGIFYVAALLIEHGHDVEILNWYDVHRRPETIERTLKEKDPDVIGFSILHGNRWGAIDIAETAKRLNPQVRIVFGGIGATYLWAHLLTHFNQIDYIITGEGEYSFLELVQRLEKDRVVPIDNIDGLAFRREGRVHHRPCAEWVKDLDRLPNPAKYFTYRHVSLTRGCAGDCTFCGSPDFWGRRVRFHSADYFVDQLAYLCRKGINFFYFSDDTFTINPKRTLAVCRNIIERNLKITWQAISRVDMINEEILYWMRRAGCIQISYGVEHGSEQIRQQLHKGLKSVDIERAFHLTTRYGIMSRAYFIYGCPGETWQTVQMTIDLIRRIKPLSIIFYILDLFPGTALYQDYKRRHNVSDDIWLNRIEDILYFETDPNLNQEQILAFGRKLRSAFYESLSDFVDAVDLVDDKTLYPDHADFLSRLAMTFDHGDYSGIDAIPEKAEIARKLYRRALAYHPDARSYLGLGILDQKEGRYENSVKILTEGLRLFPDDAHLNICLGFSCINTGRYRQALAHLLPFQHIGQALQLIVACYQAQGNAEMAAQYQKKIQTGA